MQEYLAWAHGAGGQLFQGYGGHTQLGGILALTSGSRAWVVAPCKGLTMFSMLAEILHPQVFRLSRELKLLVTVRQERPVEANAWQSTRLLVDSK